MGDIATQAPTCAVIAARVRIEVLAQGAARSSSASSLGRGAAISIRSPSAADAGYRVLRPQPRGIGEAVVR